MNERPVIERLQPCLLDRLTDNDPSRKNESRDARVVSLRQYKSAVLRDLSNLLNSKARPPDDPIHEFPEVSRSVLNYGLRDLCGLSISNLRTAEIIDELEKAILIFETRILKNSLSVNIASSLQGSGIRSICFEIEGEIWAQPLPDHLYVKTEVDIESGHYDIKD